MPYAVQSPSASLPPQLRSNHTTSCCATFCLSWSTNRSCDVSVLHPFYLLNSTSLSPPSLCPLYHMIRKPQSLLSACPTVPFALLSTSLSDLRLTLDLLIFSLVHACVPHVPRGRRARASLFSAHTDPSRSLASGTSIWRAMETIPPHVAQCYDVFKRASLLVGRAIVLVSA